jgi:hypothetical protein
MEFPILNDSQDRHKIGDRNPRNAVYIDGSVAIMRELGVDEGNSGEGDGG